MITVSNRASANESVIVIAVPTWSDLRRLDAVFRRLSSGEAASVDLHREPEVVVRNVAELTLSLASNMRTEGVQVFPDGRVRWTRTRDGWEEASGLLNGLVMHTRNELGFGDATIEVALGAGE